MREFESRETRCARLACSRLLRSRERGYGHPKAVAAAIESGEKWAGANSNRGYGHPKAEGYQATPPARKCTVSARLFNASGTAQLGRLLAICARSKPLVAVRIQIVMGHRDRLIGV
ncbi:hypothetical protein SAMN05421752_102406 [Natronorubrum thiooxidans]|uniref:Uncharacterized protein n=1 Tax=Natronorubrum thiooxidans TaxID=308853 RepID=A0A1N7DNW0_9EURY|nr:hypothetical protein SAMN05421752_102406 [Natronorubrum thiooxidans]